MARLLRELAIFRVLQELTIAVRTDWSFLLGITFCDFQKVPNKSLMIFSFLLNAWMEEIFSSNNTVCVARCFTEQNKLLFSVIRLQTRTDTFLAIHFLQKKRRIQDREYLLLRSKFLLEKCLRGYFFAGRWKNHKN